MNATVTSHSDFLASARLRVTEKTPGTARYPPLFPSPTSYLPTYLKVPYCVPYIESIYYLTWNNTGPPACFPFLPPTEAKQVPPISRYGYPYTVRYTSSGGSKVGSRSPLLSTFLPSLSVNPGGQRLPIHRPNSRIPDFCPGLSFWAGTTGKQAALPFFNPTSSRWRNMYPAWLNLAHLTYLTSRRGTDTYLPNYIVQVVISSESSCHQPRAARWAR